MSPAAQRVALGRLCAVFGGLHLLPVAFVLLSSAGPAPVAITARTWSAFYFGHFVALVCAGYGFLFGLAYRDKVFHGGPMLDFTIGVGLLAVLSSFGRAWIPGVFLLTFGLRLANGRALLSP